MTFGDDRAIEPDRDVPAAGEGVDADEPAAGVGVDDFVLFHPRVERRPGQRIRIPEDLGLGLWKSPGCTRHNPLADEGVEDLADPEDF